MQFDKGVRKRERDCPSNEYIELCAKSFRSLYRCHLIAGARCSRLNGAELRKPVITNSLRGLQTDSTVAKSRFY